VLCPSSSRGEKPRFSITNLYLLAQIPLVSGAEIALRHHSHGAKAPSNEARATLSSGLLNGPR